MISGARMRPVGGEIPFKQDENLFTYITDSGRSSLRLIVQSGFRDTKFLLPDFLCGVIPRVLDELGVHYAYYRVKPDLSIDAGSVEGKEFDVLYVINYFGLQQDYRHLLGRDTWVVEDSVFSPIVERPPELVNWVGFNSFRKISFLADGSLVKSTVRLSDGLVAKQGAAFSALKYQAKQMKFEYLQEQKHSEEKFLALFEEAEKTADRQTQIYSISDRSLFSLLEFYRKLDDEYRARRRNYRLAQRQLRKFGLRLRTDYPSFYILSVDRRDELRHYLYSQRVFLPVHWPSIDAVENDLYDRIISVPVDSRYGEQDMVRIAANINGFYGVG